jgi:hypothetical protein
MSPNRVEQKQYAAPAHAPFGSISILFIRTMDTCEDVALSNPVEDVQRQSLSCRNLKARTNG